jgi:anti-sigma B factor antagonist
MQSRREGLITVLSLDGRFDAHNAPEVVEWLEKNIEANAAQLVINLTEVKFIDSTALAALVKGIKRCRQLGGDLRLCGLQKPVQIVFELTRLDKAFYIFADERAAVGSFDA